MERLFLYVTYAVGNSTYYLLPLIATALVGLTTLSEWQIALLLSIEVALKTLASLATRFFFFRFLTRIVATILILIALGANLATAFSDSFIVLLTMRMVAGVAYGILTALIYYQLGRTSEPDKAFSMALVYLIGLGMILLAVSSWLGVGMQPLFLLVAFVSLWPLLLSPWLKIEHGLDSKSPSLTSSTVDAPSQNELLTAGFASIFLFFCAMNIVWVSLAAIGQAVGMSLEKVSVVLAISLVLSFAGASASAVVTQFSRWRLWLYLGSSLAIALSLGTLIVFPVVLGFLISVLVFDFFYALVIPIQSGMISLLDRSGKAAMLIPVSQGLGLAAGAAIPGLLPVTNGYWAPVVVSMGVLLASIGLFLVFHTGTFRTTKVTSLLRESEC